MTKDEHDAIAALSMKMDTMIAQCAGCSPLVRIHDKIMFENSGRATGPGVAPSGLVPEHRDLMAALENARFVKQSLLTGIFKEIGRWTAGAVVLGTLLYIQSHIIPIESKHTETLNVNRTNQEK